MAAEGTLVIERDRLLWRTRGERWDYDFILWPTHLEAPWWSAFKEIFPRHEAREQQDYLRGVFTLGWNKEQPYVAVSLLDPKRKDNAGRPIAHFLVYLCSVEEAGRFPAGWGAALLTALDVELAQLYAEQDPGAGVFRSLVPAKVPLQKLGDPAPFRIGPKVDLKKKTLPSLWTALPLLVLALLLLRTSCPTPQPPTPDLSSLNAAETR